MIARHGGCEILQHEAGRIDEVHEHLRYPDVHRRCDLTVEAVFALPDPHHLGDEASAGIERRKFQDHRLGNLGVRRRDGYARVGP